MFPFKTNVFEIYIDKEKQKNEIARRRKFACATFLTHFFLKRNLITLILYNKNSILQLAKTPEEPPTCGYVSIK
jgi:hypothetical protein